MGDHFPRYFNNPGQLIINVSWQVAEVDGKLGEERVGGEVLFFFSFLEVARALQSLRSAARRALH